MTEHFTPEKISEFLRFNNVHNVTHKMGYPHIWLGRSDRGILAFDHSERTEWIKTRSDHTETAVVGALCVIPDDFVKISEAHDRLNVIDDYGMSCSFSADKINVFCTPRGDFWIVQLL